jgi:hypothetical protein
LIGLYSSGPWSKIWGLNFELNFIFYKITNVE